MKKWFKKISALVMTAIMVLTMCSTVFAAAVSDKDTATITITGLNTDETPTVKLYKVVKGNYSEQGFLGTYTNANGVTIADLNNPTEEEINTIAQGIAAGTITSYADTTPVEEVPATVEGDTATATATGAGVYIALITGATKTVYNPLYIGVSYNKNSELSYDPISAGDLYAHTAVAKKTSPDIKKEITFGIKTDGDKATVSVGDVVNYKLTPTVPSYPTNAVNKTFFVSDTMTDGLDFNFTSLTLTAEGHDVTATPNSDNTTITYTINGITVATAAKVNNGFNMNFSYDGLDNLNAENAKGTMPALTITYNARVNENAVVGGDGNTNTAEIYYSNTPNAGRTWDKVNEKPGKGNGIETKTDTKTVYSYQIALKKVDGVDTSKVLAGAVFGIYEDEACTKLVDEITTNESGYAVSTAVAKGTYYVKELVAPTGYKLSTKVYPVDAQWATATSTVTGETIRTTYTTTKEGTDGKQVGWILNDTFYNMNNKPTSDNVQPAYVENTSSTTATNVSVVENKNGVVPTLVEAPVPNTTLSQLPSTGGMGTYIFTIVGVVLMACAAGAFFMSRRKTEE